MQDIDFDRINLIKKRRRAQMQDKNRSKSLWFEYDCIIIQFFDGQ